ncbi:winged helix-turn-helix domain-containing protein [Sulfuracidifex tepidarius]|uniref:ArnR1-like winged helix-turn-helix domain-containing protein n=1 Tax=Sulfuracidifex tepidarius TaxID=1294262 RepID=A0A510DTS1_9CREN|nr:winged helix-turn-helix domain-containing protein [Sulfuracidifex tepidarius]BBG23591.1 hypothetical protein IC006_0879 [Sulfuracidifex tepidarius]BBG26338.1 hypothetical protein IC007_0846 [Sulfuracidifex tepidarius]
MNRCRHDIVMDILISIKNGRRKITEICTSSNLPVDRGKKILDEMCRQGLVLNVNGEFRLSSKGYSWLEIYNMVEQYLTGGDEV